MRRVHQGPPRAKGGGPPSAEELLLLLPYIRGVARRAGADPGLVDELADEALFQAWTSAQSFRGFPDRPRLASLRAWVAVIARHVVTAHRRRTWREHVGVEHLPVDTFVMDPDGQIEARLVLPKMLAKLTPKLRRFAAELAVTGCVVDVAATLGIKAGTAFTRTRKLRRKLRRFR